MITTSADLGISDDVFTAVRGAGMVVVSCFGYQRAAGDLEAVAQK
jgi:hypothetical protein